MSQMDYKGSALAVLFQRIRLSFHRPTQSWQECSRCLAYKSPHKLWDRGRHHSRAFLPRLSRSVKRFRTGVSRRAHELRTARWVGDGTRVLSTTLGLVTGALSRFLGFIGRASPRMGGSGASTLSSQSEAPSSHTKCGPTQDGGPGQDASDLDAWDEDGMTVEERREREDRKLYLERLGRDKS